MKRRVRAFAGPGNVGRLFVGACIRKGRNPCAKQAEPKRLAEVEAMLAKEIGGATVARGDGVWHGPRGVEVDHTRVVEVAAGGSCAAFRRSVWNGAALAARVGRQASVLAVTTCADGGTDASLIDRHGRRSDLDAVASESRIARGVGRFGRRR